MSEAEGVLTIRMLAFEKRTGSESHSILLQGHSSVSPGGSIEISRLTAEQAAAFEPGRFYDICFRPGRLRRHAGDAGLDEVAH